MKLTPKALCYAHFFLFFGFFSCSYYSQDSITLVNGNVNVKEPPRAVSERDERLLAEKIEKITEEATDSDSDDETMGSVDV